MANCPVCQSDISITTQHFGTLYTCPQCSGVFFVDWNGQPEAAATNEDPPTTEFPEAFTTPEGFETPPYEQAPVPHEEVPYDGGGYSSEPVANDEPQEDYDFNQPLEEQSLGEPFSESMPIPEPMTPLTPEKNPLEDISDFGNADLSQAAFNYIITIEGIDSGVIRKQLQEALTDSKFGWDSAQLMAQIIGGVLTIRSVNPVKASILIQRLKYLSVKISWRQDVLSSTV